MLSSVDAVGFCATIHCSFNTIFHLVEGGFHLLCGFSINTVTITRDTDFLFFSSVINV